MHLFHLISLSHYLIWIRLVWKNTSYNLFICELTDQKIKIKNLETDKKIKFYYKY